MIKLDDAEMERYVMKYYGTSGSLAFYANIGNSPIQNWLGINTRDYPTRFAAKISNGSVTQYNKNRYGCHHCPLCCGAEIDIEKFNNSIHDIICELKPDEKGRGPHKPEYETLCGFGDIILSDNVHSIISIIKSNDICKQAGMDTISCAVTVSWAFNAYENGVLTKVRYQWN